MRTSTIAEWPAASLIAAKTAQQVAVVLPARNEQATVGEIVEAIIRAHGGGPAPLVDEVIVVDSGSDDDTAAVAVAAGARVVTATRPGKGEAMWLGVEATRADIVVFVDADLEQFDPGFVSGLLGPLLSDSDVDFVKATYDRPVHGDRAVMGGRVTELMARPLLAAFWPQLGGILQPLSGEYAARRSLLRRLPFRCGYGVDIGLLIDAYEAVGLEGMAQVDLRERHHRHSDLASLGRMAAEVMHTALDRLMAAGRLPADLDLVTTMAQPSRIDEAQSVVRHEIDTSQRPALDGALAARL